MIFDGKRGRENVSILSCKEGSWLQGANLVEHHSFVCLSSVVWEIPFRDAAFYEVRKSLFLQDIDKI